jgi:hypothetical protein
MDTPEPGATNGADNANPWHDPVLRRRATDPPLHHRLSYDDATGVIMLPDDEWDMEDVGTDSDSEDYGSSLALEHEPEAGPSAAHAEGPEPVADSERTPMTAPASPATKRRHQTYYHHPERRRQTISIPGAFPVVGSPSHD